MSATPSKTAVWAYECPGCYQTYEPAERPDGGRCGKCDDAPNLREKQSEFGAGVVVCLAKFSEHLADRSMRRIWDYLGWLRSPSGDSPLKFAEGSFHRYPALRNGAKTPQEYALHDAIHMWANAAGDHFFDLDRDHAPDSLWQLAELVLELRNAHLTDTPRLFTNDDLDRVRKLWRESCIALDQALGVVPNWGEY